VDGASAVGALAPTDVAKLDVTVRPAGALTPLAPEAAEADALEVLDEFRCIPQHVIRCPEELTLVKWLGSGSAGDAYLVRRRDHTLCVAKVLVPPCRDGVAGACDSKGPRVC
jgi:hypothetical protein